MGEPGDFHPDYRHFLAVMRNERPTRLPLYEHAVGRKMIEDVLGVSFRDGLAADASDRLSYFREYCRFFRQMRYDGFSPSLTVVPEPATIGLLALGGLALRRSRRQAGRRR